MNPSDDDVRQAAKYRKLMHAIHIAPIQVCVLALSYGAAHLTKRIDRAVELAVKDAARLLHSLKP